MFCFLTSLAPRAEVFQLLLTEKMDNSALQCDHINSDYSSMKLSPGKKKCVSSQTINNDLLQDIKAPRVGAHLKWEHYVEICDEKVLSCQKWDS